MNPLDPAALRREAEERLREIQESQKDQTSSEIDTLVLLQELQVHQIELEMQNEELIKARAELENVLQLYTDLYDFAPVGYLTLGSDGSILKANLAAGYLLGKERGLIIDQRLGLFISPQSQTTYKTFFEKVFSRGGKETCEVALTNKDRSPPIWVHLEAIIDASAGQQEACRVVLVDITDRKHAEDLLREQSTHDELTGIYNRNFFMTELARLERGRNFPISIVMADLDSLKQTNDNHGHAAGDTLLKRAAQILTTAFRAEDVVARIGGDEFAVLLSNTNAEAVQLSLQRVRQVIQKFNEDPNALHVQLSIGASTAVDPGPLEPVLKDADKNMYEEKRRNNPDR